MPFGTARISPFGGTFPLYLRRSSCFEGSGPPRSECRSVVFGFAPFFAGFDFTSVVRKSR